MYCVRRIWLPIFALLLMGLIPSVASAETVPVRQICHAGVTAAESFAVVFGNRDRWHCDDSGWSIAGEAVLIRFALEHGKGQPLPQSVSTYVGNFERMDVGVIDRYGRARWTSWGPEDLQHLSAGPYMIAPLAGVDADSAYVAVRLVRPWSKTTLSEMRLDSAPRGSEWPLSRIVEMAVICGMLLAPLLINTAFYSVLPERYVLWHLVMVAAMLAQAAFATGFVHLVVDANPLWANPLWEWQASNIAFATMTGAALMFAVAFMEPDKLDPRLRKAATWLAPVVGAVGAISCIPIEAVRPWSSPAMHVIIGLAIAMIVAMLANGWHRGSIVVRFQIVGWTPILLIGSYRILAYLLPSLHPTEAIVVYQLALVFEVLVTALGIVDRFVDVRQQRDDANARALELEGVAGCDPLTGLRNRHSIEQHFEEWFATGFRTMAVIDLDKFKEINDTHGHAVGDVVLRCVAGALREDRDTRAIRMGGEEFLLLLRGQDSTLRAERCRLAISTRVAAEVPGLDRMVTASMGLVEHDTRGSLKIEFVALYTRCDQLLYEAKRLGRNRTVKEKVTGFAPAMTAVGQSNGPIRA